MSGNCGNYCIGVVVSMLLDVTVMSSNCSTSNYFISVVVSMLLDVTVS
jgi:hypothetical protein